MALFGDICLPCKVDVLVLYITLLYLIQCGRVPITLRTDLPLLSVSSTPDYFNNIIHLFIAFMTTTKLNTALVWLVDGVTRPGESLLSRALRTTAQALQEYNFVLIPGGRKPVAAAVIDFC